MGRVIELIKSFINPAPKEKSFEELAVAAGIGEADLNMLKKTMGGVNWKFEEEVATKKGRKSKIDPEVTQVRQTQGRVRTNESERDRD